MLKNLFRRLTSQPSEERMRRTLELFKVIPRRIRTLEDALHEGGLEAIIPLPKTVSFNN